MKKTILSTLLLAVALSVGATTKYYIADEETNFPNPERGFYHASEQSFVATTTTSNLDSADFLSSNGRSLVFRQYVFKGFLTDSLSPTVLNLIDQDFLLFRQMGFKCVLRFSYTVSQTKKDGKYQDGSPEIWKMHLEQLKPIMAKNADVIACVQAGMLGVWGEWFYSSQGEGTKIPKQVKKDLINQLLDAVPVCRAVQLRTPKYKAEYIGDSKALTEEEAFLGTPRARLGHHNDAFLYESDNMGTYTNRTRDMNYLDQECLYLPNGGESDVTTKDVYNQWATSDKAKADMAKVHFSYINQDYSGTVINGWKKEGQLVDIARHLGYRYHLLEATVPSVQRPDELLPIRMRIQNVGYASLYNERPVYIALIGADTTYVLKTDIDPRFWAPNSAVSQVVDSLPLPADVQEGEYDVALWMPDAFASIQADPRYAVRFANMDMWDAERGYNMLDIKVNISTTATPEPEPVPVPQADVDAVTGLNAVAGEVQANLSWINPYSVDSVFMATRIVRKDGAAPTSINDGVLVYYGAGQQCVDVEVEGGHTYYYAAYAVNKDGRIAQPASTSVYISPTDIEEIVTNPTQHNLKIIYNGQLLISRHGTWYNAMGEVMVH